MKIFFLSDVHNEFTTLYREEQFNTHPDVMVLAGDIDKGCAGAAWANDYYKDIAHKVYVSGNHEFYNMGDINAMMSRLDQFDKGMLSLVMPGRYHIIEANGERLGVIGGTLWTDLLLYGESWFHTAANQVSNRMNDYRLIGFEDPQTAFLRTFRVSDMLEFNEQFRLGMEEGYRKLEEAGIEKILCVTHHAPHENSIAKKYRDVDVELNTAYASNMEQWIIDRPLIKLWIHGHVHNTFDYMVGQCRVVTNPRGYTHNTRSRHPENNLFDPVKVIEI